MKNTYLLLVILISFHTQANVSVFNHFGTQSGLSDSNIKSIIEDKSGFIWVGTATGLFKFNGFFFEKINSSKIVQEINIKTLFIDDDNSILIGSKNQGLLRYKNDSFTKIPIPGINGTSVNAIIKDNQKQLWLATSSGVFQQSIEKGIHKTVYSSLNFLHGKYINTLEELSGSIIAMTANNHIHLFNKETQSVRTIALDKGVNIHDLHEDNHNQLWIATSKKLFRYDLLSNQTLSTPQLKNASRVLSIDQYQNNIWIATIDGGLFQVNVTTLKTQQYLPQKNLEYSLSENNIMTIYISENGLLWAGGFSTGLNMLDLNLNQFNFHSLAGNNINCVNDSHTYSIEKDHSNTLWLGNSNGLLKWNQTSQECQLINNISNINNETFTVYDTKIDGEIIWIASSNGLLKYNFQTEMLDNVSQELVDTTVFFIHLKNKRQMLLGTSKGLFEYDNEQQDLSLFSVGKKKYKNISFRSYTRDKKGHFFFPTSQGLLQIGKNNQLQEFTKLNMAFVDKNIINIAANKDNQLFISIKQSGLYHLNADHKLIHHYYQDRTDNTIYKIMPEDNGQILWLSTDKGIVSLNLNNHQSNLYANEAGNNYLKLNQATYLDKDGYIYFGGIGGFVNFKPEKITSPPRPYPLKFNKLYLNGTPITLDTSTVSESNLNSSTKNKEILVFNHKNKVIGFGFTQLNYNNPKETDFFYRLGPNSSEWIPLPNYQRRITFNSLKAGDYQLDIKSRYFTGESSQSLSFTVKNPPWFSWWAFVCYFMIALALLFFYIKRRIATEKKINAYLNQQVKKQTAHIEQQKKTVEDLMARKNEIFSNVSHEFRTPITLILGPIEELQRAEKASAKKDSFDMISRNAKRLLSLVNQMLKLAQINEVDETQKQLINLSSHLNMIIEPFVYLAKKNGLNLIIKPIDDIKMWLTEDALETIINNFLSNAIKYTSRGGEVIIGTHSTSKHIVIYVKDTGCGICKKDQNLIFKRFNRLHQESSSGTGIGLALVKELADLNQAELSLHSEIDQGSEFSIKIAIDLSIQNHNEEPPLIDLTTADNLDNQETLIKQTVLIIDDNKDMRHYIKQVLSPHFKCLLAVDGLEGISSALKYVPDIIICDVMMPKVDGFHVCRKLRSEIITSHIPLVLLTAVDEKSSRIKGWRENIDRYLNKPFDAQELVLQLKNILNTRQFMVKKNDGIKTKSNSYLTDKDQQFIDKLKEIIEKGYTDPLLNLQKIASLMFISDRQLQRKTKALINDSPMDMVRENRLAKSAEMLIKGKQISYISDVCGFSSVSYFSRSFKKNYGMTPKAYQKLKHQ